VQLRVFTFVFEQELAGIFAIRRAIVVAQQRQPSMNQNSWQLSWLCTRQAAGYLLWHAGIVI